jgi:hypothetical protein
VGVLHAFSAKGVRKSLAGGFEFRPVVSRWLLPAVDQERREHGIHSRIAIGYRLARRSRKSGVVRVLLGKRKLQQNFLFHSGQSNGGSGSGEESI